MKNLIAYFFFIKQKHSTLCFTGSKKTSQKLPFKNTSTATTKMFFPSNSLDYYLDA